MEVQLQWSGPYSFLPGTKPVILEAPEARAGGIYMWTVAAPVGRLLYYVGQTEAGFANRHFEHWVEYWRGAYTIHDPISFGQGVRSPIYKGYAYRTPRWERAREFVSRFRELNAPLLAMLQQLEIWLAPSEVDRRLQRRIESAIVAAAYTAPAPAGDFQERGMRMEPRRSDETPVIVANRPVRLVIGLPDRLDA
jgi:hypothetical protein